MSTYETESEVRAAVERRLGETLTFADWSTASDGHNAPFDDVDVREILDAATALPVLATRRAQRLSNDVDRVRRQILGYEADSDTRAAFTDPVGAIYGLLEEFDALDRVEAGTQTATSAATTLQYATIGKAVHEAVAVDGSRSVIPSRASPHSTSSGVD